MELSIGLDPVYKHLMARGNAEAQFELGGMYHIGAKRLMGQGVPKDHPKDHMEAAKWYQLAIEQVQQKCLGVDVCQRCAL